MSLINQVLNELENRGVRTSAADEAIRPVPARKSSRLGLYAFIAVSMLLAAGAWYLLRLRQPAPLPSPPVASMPAKELVTTMAASAAAALPASGPAVAAAEQIASSHERIVVAAAADDEVNTRAQKKTHKRLNKKHAAEKMSPQEAVAVGDTPDQPLKQVTPQQRIENAYARANQATQDARFEEARAAYEEVLSLNPSHHAARQALAGVLVRLKRNDEAERVLQEGLRLAPKEVPFAMLLARLQVERGAVPAALETLQAATPYAEGRADFQAFEAVLLQRQNRHDEAVGHFQAALKLAPNNGIWLMGLGMSLQALQRNSEARDAYQRALATNSLNAQLQAFVQGKLNEL